MSDLRVRATVRLRNDVLLEARTQHGMSQPVFAKHVGVPVSFLMAVEKLDYSTIRPGNAGHQHAARLAHYLCVDIDVIAPSSLTGVRVKSQHSSVAQVSPGNLLGMSKATEVLALPADELVSEAEHQAQLKAGLLEALDTLGGRNALLLKLRYGLGGHEPHSLKEVGSAVGVTQERVRQLILRAEGKLCHPSRDLERFVKDAPVDWSRRP